VAHVLRGKPVPTFPGHALPPARFPDACPAIPAAPEIPLRSAPYSNGNIFLLRFNRLIIHAYLAWMAVA
jgi:hypothetical protein